MAGGVDTAGAAAQVRVYINGQQANFPDAQPVIVDGRTLVPLRFIAESPSFGAAVSYDDAARQVTLVRGQRTIVLWPASRTIMIDGKSCETDVAPQIRQSRTMVPLRFLSESFGATVDWNGTERTVSVAIDPPERLVLGYYYGGSYDEFLSRYDSLTDVAFHWYEVDQHGQLLDRTPASYRLALDFTARTQVRPQASVSLFDTQKLHLLLSSAAARNLFADNLLKLARREGYQVINLDLEAVAPADKDAYLELLSLLSRQFRPAGIGFVVAVPAKDRELSWNAAYDYGAIARYADRVVLMAYDFHYSTDAPGPLAPYNWVVGVVDYAGRFFAPQQMILGVGNYGYDWPAGQKATSLSASQAEALAAAHGARPAWDNDASAPHFEYTDDQGARHEVWYENRESLKLKLDLAKSRGLAGISIWRLGCGFPDFWADVNAFQEA